jgi:uncharacterized protein (TIGR02265 family)
MPADRSDLAARLAAATPEDTVRGLIFNALFDLARENGGEEAALQCDPLGKGTRSDFRSFPVADLLKALWAAADRLEPHLGSADRVFFDFGYRCTANFLGSMIGHTILTFGRTPRGLIGQAPAAYRTVASYGERAITWPEPTQAHLEFDRDFLPVEHHRGVLQAALDGTGAKKGQVEGRATGFLRATFDVSWQP